MNVLGVGGSELLIVLLIMLVIAGPKRMIHWSYVLGQHLSKFRRMWSETVDIVQKEFDEAGVGIQLPKDVPTRGSLNKQAGKLMSGVTAPMQETLDEVNTELGNIKTTTKETATSANSTVRGSNGSQTVLKTGLESKPVLGTPTASKTAAVTPSTASATPPAIKATARKAAKRADDDFGAWSRHEAAQVGSWSRDEAPTQTEDKA